MRHPCRRREKWTTTHHDIDLPEADRHPGLMLHGRRGRALRSPNREISHDPWMDPHASSVCKSHSNLYPSLTFCCRICFCHRWMCTISSGTSCSCRRRLQQSTRQSLIPLVTKHSESKTSSSRSLRSANRQGFISMRLVDRRNSKNAHMYSTSWVCAMKLLTYGESEDEFELPTYNKLKNQN